MPARCITLSAKRALSSMALNGGVSEVSISEAITMRNSRGKLARNARGSSSAATAAASNPRRRGSRSAS
jgi:Na+/alanine symporter